MELYKIYRPMTAAPFRNSDNYMECEPCEALKPYIQCFWGTRRTVRQRKSDRITYDIVTPDTCMDIIFTVDFTNNTIDNRFAGLDDRAFATHIVYKEDKTSFMFGIRFFMWGVMAFTEESLRNTKNTFFDVGCHFSKIKKEIEKYLFDVTDLYQLISITEKVLLNCLNDRNQNQSVLGAIHKIVANKGNLLMTDLKSEVLVGSRQLERLFAEYVGVSPKSLAAMVRYQCLWRDILYHNNFNILDAVYRYGYSDQAHLCHDFKKYHSMNMAEARKFALQNVGNIQDTSSRS